MLALEGTCAMCGIAVAIDWDNAEEAVRRLIGGIMHRGDISDPVVSPRAKTAMGTRRLKIVDPEHGRQPQASFDGQILVSFNGEIYNHKILRVELEAMGLVFRTGSDTEVLANALRAWGGNALGRLSGMFAFIALDLRNGEFLAARDPFGVKPLYVIQSGNGFLFCSEIRPLLETSPEGDVLLVPPGHFLTRQGCGRYQVPAHVAQEHSPVILDRILEQAITSRLPDGLPAAALFSGGIDSTLLVHYARRHRPDMPAYFAGTPEAPDAIFASAYAEMTGLDLRRVECGTGPENLALIERAVGAVEAFEPVVIRPAIYAWQVSQRMHQDGFRVALCGEGADELFAGYSHLERAYALGQEAGRGVQRQCLDLMHRANLQRVDRCGMRFELEVREPFLDSALAAYADSMNADELLRNVGGALRGKEPLREIYDLYLGELPVMIRDRRKIGFDEGAGLKDDGGWQSMFEAAVGDAELAEGCREFAEYEIGGKEELFCLRALAKSMDVSRVPHLKSRLRLLMPQMARSGRTAAA
jgi:asparagine synthase (glutamine-hydrolysing)